VRHSFPLFPLLPSPFFPPLSGSRGSSEVNNRRGRGGRDHPGSPLCFPFPFFSPSSTYSMEDFNRGGTQMRGSTRKTHDLAPILFPFFPLPLLPRGLRSEAGGGLVCRFDVQQPVGGHPFLFFLSPSPSTRSSPHRALRNTKEVPSGRCSPAFLTTSTRHWDNAPVPEATCYLFLLPPSVPIKPSQEGLEA